MIADAPQAGSTTKAAIDSIGDRLCTSSGSGFGWIVADLHGNVAGQTNSSGGSLLDVLRYDAYGKALGSPGTPSSVPTPWRFQGRILESTSGSDAYDFDARSYVPDLGTFSSLDSVTGSAQNPLTLNRYLYANANPATLIDPDGHFAGDRDDERGYVVESSSVNAATGFTTGAHSVMDGEKAAKDRAAKAVKPGLAKAFASGGGKQISRPDCGGNLFCDVNNAIGTAGDVIRENPAAAVFVAGVLTCAGAIAVTMGAATPVCTGLLQGAIIGGGSYLSGTVAGNLWAGKGLSLEGATSEGFFTSVDIGAATSGAGQLAGKALSLAGARFDGLSWWQTGLAQGGSTGGLQAATQILLKAATSTTSPFTAVAPVTQVVAPIVLQGLKEAGSKLRPFLPWP